MKTQQSVGLKQQMRLATTQSQLNGLYAKAFTFKQASKKTKHAWNRVYKIQYELLSQRA